MWKFPNKFTLGIKICLSNLVSQLLTPIIGSIKLKYNEFLLIGRNGHDFWGRDWFLPLALFLSKQFCYMTLSTDYSNGKLQEGCG